MNNNTTYKYLPSGIIQNNWEAKMFIRKAKKNMASSPTYTFGRERTRTAIQKYYLTRLKNMLYNMFLMKKCRFI
jgi:hypothetical protein